MTKDLNKGISNIQYNSLNLPSVVTFSDGSTITYTYTHDGKKLRTVHVIGSTTTTTDYCGNVIYENGTAKRLLTDEGYVDLTTSTPTYYYYQRDHQGNNRAVLSATGTVKETNDYNPFGGLFATSTNVQPYKYNGKELDTKGGLNLYDYGARHYDAALGRWHVVDPMAEKYYNLTPYAFTGNHGLNALEIDGGLFIFVNGFYPMESLGHYAYHTQRNSSSPYNPIPIYNPDRSFKDSDFYGWGNVDKLYMEQYNDANALYINGSFGILSRASVRYDRGMESGRELIEKLRSGELTLGKDETIKIVGYSMGGAYAAGMANALMQDSDYAHLLQFVDYLAPHQPSSFEHPEGVLGRQFASDKDWFTTYKAINNISFRKVEHFGSLLDFGAHLLSDDFYDFLMNCFNNGVPIYYGD